MPKFVFVLEQTLGHVAHGRNLERILLTEPDIEATIIRVDYTRARGLAGLVPGLSTWSAQASLTARAALAKRFRQGPVEAIFIHTQVASLLSVPFMRRIPTVISLDATPRNFDSQGASYGHRRAVESIEGVKSALNRRAFAAAGALVCWCDWAGRSLVHDYGVPAAKVTVVAPGVDLALFRPSPPRTHDGPVRLLFVGGDFARKGGPDLLGAIRRLRGAIELDIVTGSDVTDVPPEIRCRIHRGLGPQSPALVELYRSADIFVLPSRGDCLPQAVAEAMACGLPIVATDVGAMSEMVRPGENGYLVPPASPRELARALSALVDHPILRQAMGYRSRKRAERDHDASRNNRRIFALMRELAARRVSGVPVAAAVTAGAP